MTLGGFAVASCGLFAAGVHAVTAFAKSPVEVYADASRSVVVIHAQQGAGQIARGSGVIVAPEWVVTNCHVVGPASLVTLRRGEQQLPASPGPRDEGADVCLVHSPYLSKMRGIAPVRRAISPPKPGSRVFAIGAPHNLELTITEGLLSGTRYRGAVPVMQVSAAISPGSSGGGLFDEEARLIGITTFYLDGGQNLSFAVPVDGVDRLLAEAQRLRAEPAGVDLSYDPFAEEGKPPRRATGPPPPRTPSLSARELQAMVDKASGFLYPGSPNAEIRALITRANALLEARRWPDLLAVGFRIVDHAPSYYQGWQVVGTAYLRLGRYADAEAALKRALELKPGDEWLASLLTSVQKQTSADPSR